MKIMRAAVELFLSQGIRKTSMEEIAHQAGVSRVTLYRRYSGRKELVRAVVMQGGDAFGRIRAAVEGGKLRGPFDVTELFKTELGKLGDATMLGKFDELRRVYPDIYEEYRVIRKEALDAIFGHILTMLSRGGMLRPEINEKVLRLFFFNSIIAVIENPDMADLNMPREEILGTIREIMLHGIIVPGAEGGKKGK